MRIRYLLLTILAAVAFCRYCSGASIGTPSLSVTGAEVTLNDLRAVIKMDEKAAPRLKSAVVAVSPLPGKSRLITREEIARRLRRYGLDSAVLVDCPEAIEVTRSSATVAGEEIIAAGEGLLREQYPVQKGEELIISPITPPRDLIVPVGKVEIVAEAAGSIAGRSLAAITVTVLVEGRLWHRTVVNYRLQLMGDLLVASRDLSRHLRLAAADFRLERRDLLSFRGAPLRAPEEACGRRTTQRVVADTPLTDLCTEPAPLVLKGQEVTVTVLASGVILTAPGIAREDGALGEAVRVRTALSKEDFSAKVVGEANVEIEVTPQRRNQ